MTIFATGLPSDDGDHVASASETIGVPATLPGGLVALDSEQVPGPLAEQLADPQQQQAARTATAAQVTEVFGAAAGFRVYVDADATKIAVLTALAGEPGLFVPDGPPLESTEGATYELAKIGDAVCATYDRGPAASRRAHCQLGRDGVTYDLDGRGMDAEEVVTALEHAAKNSR